MERSEGFLLFVGVYCRYSIFELMHGGKSMGVRRC